MTVGRLSLLCLLLFSSACSAPQISERRVDSAQLALQAFRADSDLQPFFEQAVAYAVYPAAWRGGTGFGAAYGSGLVYSANGRQLIGSSNCYQFLAGADIGLQFYRQILFFKTEHALRRFQRQGIEFAGQAHIAAGPWGAGVTPAYHDEIAVFSQLRAGLLIEASVGAHGYSYKPLLEQQGCQRETCD